MNFNQAIGFDLETEGDLAEYMLQPYRATIGQARIKAASVYYAENDFKDGFLYPDSEKIRSSLGPAVEDNQYIIGWNIPFDVAWLIATGHEDLAFRAKWLDAMLLWKHAVVEPEGEDVPKNKRKSYSLKSAMEEFFPDEAGFKDFDDFEATDEASLKLLLKRVKGDAVWPVRLAEKFWGMLTPRQRKAALIEARCIPMMAKTKVLGIKSSKEDAEKLRDILAKEALEIYKKLLVDAPEIRGLNLGSPKQLQTLIYETWGMTSDRFSKKSGAPSTDKYALFDLAKLDPRCALLKDLREVKNNRQKYAIGTLNSLEYNGDGCVRPQPKVFGTYTGRLTYGSSDRCDRVVIKTFKKKPPEEIKKKVDVPVGIALHQWKRGKEYRRLIRAPEGYWLVEFDFAGQEFRLMAVASGDETMLSLCAPGEDAHGYMGAQIAQRDYRELVILNKAGDSQAASDRKCGKFCNLSYQYRVSARTATTKARVEFGLEVDESFIQQTQLIYRTSYPGVGGPPGRQVGGYWASQIRKCKELGYAETMAGRRVQLKDNWAGKFKWAMESTAINYPIQGTGGDQKYLALAVARNILPKYGGYFYYELHDGLFFIFPKAKALAACDELEPKLSNLPYKAAWGVDMPIQFPVDGKIGPSWGELEDLEKFKERQ